MVVLLKEVVQFVLNGIDGGRLQYHDVRRETIPVVDFTKVSSQICEST